MNRRGKVSLVLLFFAVCGSAALFHYRTIAQETPPSHRELYAIIFAQLKAMRADDFPGAYQRASRDIQERFPIVAFRDMIRTSYSDLVKASSVELGPVRMRGSRAFVEVYFISPGRRVRPCVYILVREGDTWKIDGAQVLPTWPAGASISSVQV